MNSSQKENFSSAARTNNLLYLNENFNNSSANGQEDNICTELKMGANSKHENDELKNAVCNWTRGDGSGGFGVGASSDTIEDDIGFQDDNVSHVGSDYSDFVSAEQDNLFTQQHSHDFYGEQFTEPDIKYDPEEFTLRPPSGSAMHFNYNLPAIPSLPYTAHPRTNHSRNSTLTTNNCAQQSYLNPSPTDMIRSSVSAVAVTASPYSVSNAGCFHPNMWYPNAPYGSYRSHGSHPYGRHYGSHLSQDRMMDVFQLSNSSREARNRAEKNRRDKLNGSIQELSTMVPHVAESPRRIDKTAVLRFAAHGLRLKYVFGKSQKSDSTNTTDSLMKLLDSFFLTMTCNGQIVLVSSSIEQHLGHCQTDLYGQNILHITHPADHEMLKDKLIPTDLDKLFDIQPGNETGEPKLRTQDEEDEIDRRLREDRRSFTIRLARSGPRSEPTVYELVKIDGTFRRSDMAPRGVKTSTFPSTLQLMRRSRGREDTMPLQTISANDIVLVAIARIVRPPPIQRSVEANRLEYKTRHLIDGRIIDCDQRISIVAGYMTDEVRNLSPFTFIHQDDVRWVIVALRQMYDCNSSYGESTYRLFTGNGEIIYLHTKGFLEIDKSTNKVHSFICVNTLLDEEDGKRRVKSMKNKFSVIINTKIPHASDDVPASENPQQLEKAVLCLIQNLKSISDDEGDSESFSSTSSDAPNPHHQAHNFQYYGSSPPHTGCSSKTPPLALVPPAADSIKTSITKSVCVVKTTAAKYLRSTSSAQQQTTTDDTCRTDFDAEEMPETIFFSPEQDSRKYYGTSRKLKRKIAYTITPADDDEYVVPIHREAIENVISNSLQQINSRLNQQLNTAMEIRNQGQQYELSNTEEQIADIMKEHQKQQEMYEDITNELEVQRNNNEICSSDNEIIQKCASGSLQETQQPLFEDQKYQQQQHSLLPIPTATSPTSVTHEGQLTVESHLQL